MAKQYRLRLDEEPDDQREASGLPGAPDRPQLVLVNIHGDASGVATWLLSIADTLTQDDARARETLYRQATVLLERLEREHRWVSEPEDEATPEAGGQAGQR